MMPLRYKINVLQKLKEKGYSTKRIRDEKKISEASLQNIRHDGPISWKNIEHICAYLECQPSDFLEYVKDENKNNT